MSLGNNSVYPVTHYNQSMIGGMTIRQRYAMAAMGSLISAGWAIDNTDKSSIDWVAVKAFTFADAMIAFEEQEHAEKAKQGMGDKTT